MQARGPRGPETERSGASCWGAKAWFRISSLSAILMVLTPLGRSSSKPSEPHPVASSTCAHSVPPALALPASLSFSFTSIHNYHLLAVTTGLSILYPSFHLGPSGSHPTQSSSLPLALHISGNKYPQVTQSPQLETQTCSYCFASPVLAHSPAACHQPRGLGPCLLLTICTRSREKIWTQQTRAERVQIIAAQMVRPQTLKSKFWRRKDNGREEYRAWEGSAPHIGALGNPQRGGRDGGMRVFTLRAPRASSQVELRATFSSWPHCGQGLCRGTGGQHTQTFPSCVGVERARQPASERTQGSPTPPLTSPF